MHLPELQIPVKNGNLRTYACQIIATNKRFKKYSENVFCTYENEDKKENKVEKKGNDNDTDL